MVNFQRKLVYMLVDLPHGNVHRSLMEQMEVASCNTILLVFFYWVHLIIL